MGDQARRYASVHECGGIIVGTPMCGSEAEPLLFEAQELLSTRLDAPVEEIGAFVRELIEASLVDSPKPAGHDPKRIDRELLRLMGLRSSSELNAAARMVTIEEQDGTIELQPVRNLGRGRFRVDQNVDPPTTIASTSERALGAALKVAIEHFSPPGG
jgi:hypothetical protein